MKKVTIIILIVFICAIIYYFGFYTNTKNQNPASNPTNTIVSIDTEEAALSQVKKNSVKLSDFYNKYERFGKIQSYAKFDEEKNYWSVIFYPENTADLWYEARLSKDGNIIYEGPQAGG